jgi:hypothetical protein
METMMKKWLFFLTGVFLLCVSACQKQVSVCPTPSGTREYLAVPPEELPTPTPATNPALIPVEIGGKTILVDRVIEGPLCNDTWSGTVYVSCNVQVYPWKESPNFLKNCNLNIELGTVVYVASHNDTAYYNGCSSCHTGEVAEP